MKAVVVDMKGRYAVVMNKDGEFIKVRNRKGFRIGYEVEFPYAVRPVMNIGARAASVAAAFLLVLGLGAGVYSYNLPYSYIEMDINPSIEITANIYDRIIRVEGLNDDGEEIAASIQCGNRKLDEGVKLLLDAVVEKGYLKEDSENAVLFTVTGKSRERVERIGEGLQSSVEKGLKESNIDSVIMVENTSIEKHETAKDLGITPGKLTIIERLIESKPELKMEDLKNLQVKDIMKSIKESRKAEKEQQGKAQDSSGSKSQTKGNKGSKGNSSGNNSGGNNGRNNGNNNGKGSMDKDKEKGETDDTAGNPQGETGNSGKNTGGNSKNDKGNKSGTIRGNSKNSNESSYENKNAKNRTPDNNRNKKSGDDGQRDEKIRGNDKSTRSGGWGGSARRPGSLKAKLF